MCTECGCNDIHDHHHTTNSVHSHEHHHKKQIVINQNVLQENNLLAEKNRVFFRSKGIYCINIISSPGSGKTALLEQCCQWFRDRLAVIEGDIQTQRDAERIIRAGSRAIQIQTQGACHLDAHSVCHAVEQLDLEGVKLLIIENVGNLVCPAGYQLGEEEKIALLSLPEGDDKILKYPALFHAIQTLCITKIDLAPYVNFDVEKAINECKSLNRNVSVFQVSAKTGEGIQNFIKYLEKKAP